MFGNPKPSANDVSKALSLLLQDSELYDGESDEQEYPALVGALLLAAGLLYDLTLTDEQSDEALKHFIDLYQSVTEDDVPGAWGEFLGALTNMGDRLARLHQAMPPVDEWATLDDHLAQAASDAALLARRLAALRLGLNLTDRDGYLGALPVEFDVKHMAAAAAQLAADLAKLAVEPIVTDVTDKQVHEA